ncbi:MAG: polysaccharide deacetylase family protein [Bacilli bacterium]|nr:polysaccharide deacetylase family protein [Bacilli bacterium]
MKKIMLIFFVLLLCACHKKNENNYRVKTIIEENTNTIIAINYPITNIKKLNKKIQKYIDDTYNKFLKQYNEITFLNKKHELNIDYTYYSLDNEYISITLFKHISSSDKELILNEIVNYNYDINKKSLITFEEIVTSNEKLQIKDLIKNLLFEKYGNIIDLNKISNINYDNLKFGINSTSVSIYFESSEISNKYSDIMQIDIPLSHFSKLKDLIIEKKEIQLSIKPTINYIDISKPMIALTFDDGPSIYTEEILETLNTYHSNATFFVLGNKIEAHSGTIIKMYQYGNEIGNHSYNHRSLTKLSLEEQREQIEKTQDIIKKYTGFTPIYLRPTYGSVNSKLRNNTNLDIVLWNVDTKDWKYKDVNTIVNNTLRDVKDGSIVLMHDTHKRTSEAIKILIPKLIENGYQLVTVSELKEAQKIKNKIDETR